MGVQPYGSGVFASNYTPKTQANSLIFQAPYSAGILGLRRPAAAGCLLRHSALASSNSIWKAGFGGPEVFFGSDKFLAARPYLRSSASDILRMRSRICSMLSGFD